LIVLTFLGSKFEGSIISLRLLVFAAFAQMLNSFFVSLYAAINKQKKILYFQIFGLLINVILNFILIPMISYSGAAIATIVTEWSILILIIRWAVKNIFVTTTEWKNLLRFVLKLLMSTLITGSIILVAKWYAVNDIFTLASAFVAYVLCLQMFKCFDVVALSRRIFTFVS